MFGSHLSAKTPDQPGDWLKDRDMWNMLQKKKKEKLGVTAL